jgi:hypothetical protein
MSSARASVFGTPVALPAGWEEETVYLFAGPPPVGRPGARKDETPARPTISVARVRAATLEKAIETLGDQGDVGRVDVLVDELREHDGRRFYERVVRLADPATGLPVQQSTRIYYGSGIAWVMVFMTPAFDFKAHYDHFSRFAAELASGVPQ